MTAVPGDTPVLAVNVNASGVVSAASMVMVTVSVPLKSPSLTVNVNVSAVLAATSGAVNEGVLVVEPVKLTEGLPAV